MSGNRKIVNKAFAPKSWLPVALETTGASVAFEKSRDGLLLLSARLVLVKRSDLRDLAQDVASDLQSRYPKLDQDECYEEILKLLIKLQEQGQKAAAKLKKQF